MPATQGIPVQVVLSLHLFSHDIMRACMIKNASLMKDFSSLLHIIVAEMCSYNPSIDN